MTEESKTIGILIRDYGALGVLVGLLILVVVRLYSELNKVRSDSDERAKRHLDQIEENMKNALESSKEHAKIFADATQRQTEVFAGSSVKTSEIFAGTVRELTHAQRELMHKVLDLGSGK